jgi:hypothetical protein
MADRLTFPTINVHYASVFLLLLGVEIGIALWVNDSFIRPYLGDMLVVILLYVLVKSIFPLPPYRIATSVFFFACFVEVSQYFQIISLLGLEHNILARTIIGTHFDWKDIVAYGLGTVIILSIEHYRRRYDA